MFGPDKLVRAAAEKRWDRVKIVCSQPYSKVPVWRRTRPRVGVPEGPILSPESWGQRAAAVPVGSWAVFPALGLRSSSNKQLSSREGAC